MYGITYNGKHSEELNIQILNTRVVEPPLKNKITLTIPFMDGEYDFSNIYGATNYSTIVLEYEFLLKAKNSILLEAKRMQVENWLLTRNEKTELKDDNLKGYYYMAECTKTEFEEKNNIGVLKATFNAYPFKIGEDFEGQLKWDNFNFELDVLQTTRFQILGEKKEIALYNQGIKEVNVTIDSTGDFTVTVNNSTQKIEKGKHVYQSVKLKPGKNGIQIEGYGTIDFLFRKELL